MGRIDEAIRAFARAARLQHHRGEAHLYLGRAMRIAFQRTLSVRTPCLEAHQDLAALPPPLPERQDVAVGQTIVCGATGNRDTVREIKNGAFGVVYLADDPDADVRYALKTLQAKY